MKRIILTIVLFMTMALPMIGYSADNAASNSQQANQKPSYWVDPMEPDVHYSAPGKSRMGMELVPVYPNQKKENASTPSKE